MNHSFSTGISNMGKVVDDRLACYLSDELGFDLSRVDLNNIISQLDKTTVELNDFESLSSSVSSLIAVHETYFLRHHEQFEWIENQWFPQAINKALVNKEPIRILSAGCATGEEPYSLYSHLYPIAEAHGVSIEIDAVDICQKALDTAAKGRYSLWSMRGVDQEKEDKWLEVHSRRVSVKEWVKHGVNFFRHNLTQHFATEKNNHYDLILCRNVMIYMHLEAVNKIYLNLIQALKPDGYLMPGPSDPSPMAINDIVLNWQSSVRLYVKSNNINNSARSCLDNSLVLSPGYVTLPMSDEAIGYSGKPVDDSAPDIKTDAVKLLNQYSVIEQCISSCRYDDARKMLENNVLIDPLDVRSYVMLALLALDLDDIKLACHAIRKALFIKPESLYVVYIMSIVKRKNGDREGEQKTLKWIKKAIQSCDSSAPVEFCEELSIAELEGVIHARFS